MKSLLLFTSLFFTTILFAQESSNYFLVIDNDSIPISINEGIVYDVSKKKQLNIQLIQPNFLTYNTDSFSFKHDKAFGTSNTKVDEGVYQHMVISPLGSGFILQEFQDMNPEGMEKIFLNEITKESLNYGYEKTEERVEITLTDGKVIQGLEYKMTYKNEVEIYTVYTIGKKDEGLIIITMLLDDEESNVSLISKFLETLIIN
ncbi:hypothetical protein SCB49_04175 [unidentified eubacterium SCB49]|nr:hypothetical protein SCB49_04175 [unidentified eubacterium SCB49]